MTNQEINEAVAEKVLGWIKPPATSVLKPMWVAPPMGTVYPELPNFCTDIADAWVIAEKYGYAFQLTQSLGEWTCTFVYKINERGVGQYISANADTAPMAICLTALKAVGH